MISAKEVEAMKSRFQQQVQKRYAAELAKVKAEKIRLGQRYQKELNKVNERFKNCDSYVADMVERFSHIDYATLNYSESCFYSALERGDLDAADAILKQVDAVNCSRRGRPLWGTSRRSKRRSRALTRSCFRTTTDASNSLLPASKRIRQRCISTVWWRWIRRGWKIW